MSTVDKSLLPHEWLAVLVITCGLIFLIILGESATSSVPLILEEVSFPALPQTVVIKIEGAVEFPGKYHAGSGTKLKEVIQKAKPLLEADLKKVRQDFVVKKGMKIKIPKQKK